MADRFPDIGRIDMIQSAFSRPTNQLYNEERNDNAPQQKQQRQTTPPTNPFAPSSSQTPSNSFAPPQQQQQHLPGYPLLPTTTGYQTSSLSPMSAMTPNQPMAAGYQQPMSTGYQQPMAAAWQNQNQLSTNQPAMSMGHSGSPSPIPSMQQPMYTGWSQPQLTSMPQPLVPQETYHQQQPQQQPQQQQLPQQQQQQQLPWGAPQQQMGGGFGGGALGGQGFGGQLGYQQTGMLNAPSQAHAQMAAMTGSGYSAFDPYNPTAGNQSQGRPVSQTSASYAPPIAAASGMGSRTSLFARGEAEEWIRNCLASRRADLGPPVQPPTTFAESYRIVLDQAYENILHAIAQNNQADISTSLEVSNAAQSVREMLFRDQGEVGLAKRQNEPSTRAANRRLGEDVRLALYMRRSGPWANGSVFNDVVEDSVSGLKSIFPY